MQVQNAEDLFRYMVEKGYMVRDRNLDGLKEWQQYKFQYESHVWNLNGQKTITIHMNSEFIRLCENISIYNGKNINAILNEENINNETESGHFIVQHFRIPRTQKYRLSVVKFAQIAYNIGQARFEFRRGTYSDSFTKFYLENQLDHADIYINSPISIQVCKDN